MREGIGVQVQAQLYGMTACQPDDQPLGFGAPQDRAGQDFALDAVLVGCCHIVHRGILVDAWLPALADIQPRPRFATCSRRAA